tara:strand:+ start:822 stop:968 length:147 start_codon:yes stop_codon:yes gene_type:complete
MEECKSCHCECHCEEELHSHHFDGDLCTCEECKCEKPREFNEDEFNGA